MSDEIRVRLAREDDGEFMAGLVWSLLEFGSPLWSDPAALAPGFSRLLARSAVQQDDRTSVLIAEDGGGRPLGFISLQARHDIEGCDRAHVADLAVSEPARRRGVGTVLMRAAEAWARERELGVLGLDVWSTNHGAQAFYRRLGYIEESHALAKRLA